MTLVERLRQHADERLEDTWKPEIIPSMAIEYKAADEIEALQAKVAALEVAGRYAIDWWDNPEEHGETPDGDNAGLVPLRQALTTPSKAADVLRAAVDLANAESDNSGYEPSLSVRDMALTALCEAVAAYRESDEARPQLRRLAEDFLDDMGEEVDD